MSRGYGTREQAILAVVEAWSPFVLIELLPKDHPRSHSVALKRAAQNLADRGEIDLSYDERGRVVVKKVTQKKRLCWGKVTPDGELIPYPDSPPLKLGKRYRIETVDGGVATYIFDRYLNREPLSLEDANRIMGIRSRGRAPAWGEREAELDKQHMSGAVDATRGWRQEKSDTLDDDALMRRAERIVADRKDHLDTQRRLAQAYALEDAIEDDRRRGKKWKKGSRPRGDEDALDDDGRDFLPDEGARRAVTSDVLISAVDNIDNGIRLTAEPAGTLNEVEE